MIEFLQNSPREITEKTKGKVIESLEVNEDRADEWLVLKFTDGSLLRIRYDWLYEWEFQTKEQESFAQVL